MHGGVDLKAIDRLYKKDVMITRSVHIDEDLYSKVQYLSENIFDASVSKIINVCIEHTLQKNNITFYKKPANTDSVYRSVVLRKAFYDKLLSTKEQTGISFSRLLNFCIKNFLQDYQADFSNL